MTVTVQLIVPTLNAGELWPTFIEAVKSQIGLEFKVLVIDSGSSDHTVQLTQEARWDLIQIQKSEFNHGRTRQLGIDSLNPEIELVIFMTQDAIFASTSSLKLLLEPFKDLQIAAVYGRQLPHRNATWYAASQRRINYPDQSTCKSYEDRHHFGIKTAFFSNSFGAYRVNTLKSIGGFPSDVPLGEDMYICAKMLTAGFKIQYTANAEVFHSHNLSFIEEFKRYYMTGLFHKREKWLIDNFNITLSEGLNTIKLQWTDSYTLTLKGQIFIRFEILTRSLLKIIAYKMGRFVHLNTQSSRFRFWINS